MRLAPPAVAASPAAATAAPASAAPVSAAPTPMAKATTAVAATGATPSAPSVPPPASASAAHGTAAAAAAVGNDAAEADVKSEAGRPALPAPHAPDARASAEDTASSSRAFWDQAVARPRLDASVLEAPADRGAPAFVAPTAAVAGAVLPSVSASAGDGELHDAVAAAFPAAAPSAAARFAASASGRSYSFGAADAPARSAAPSLSAPRRLERLTLSLGADLVVQVRSVADRLAASALRLAGRGAEAVTSARRARRTTAPLTSTRWLERRGMLETAAIPGAEAAAEADRTAVPVSGEGLGRARAFVDSAAAGSRPVSVRAVPLRASSSAPLALWALAFLPATLALLRDALR